MYRRAVGSSTILPLRPPGDRENMKKPAAGPEPHVRWAEILLAAAALFLWGFRMLPEAEFRVPEPAELAHRIDLNRADWTELVNLPGIGEARAREIVRDRAERGPFRSPLELTRVHEIGPATVNGVRDHLHGE